MNSCYLKSIRLKSELIYNIRNQKWGQENEPAYKLLILKRKNNILEVKKISTKLKSE